MTYRCGFKPGDHVVYAIKKDGTEIQTSIDPYSLNVPNAFFLADSFSIPRESPEVRELIFDLCWPPGRKRTRTPGEKKLLELLGSEDIVEIKVKKVKPYNQT